MHLKELIINSVEFVKGLLSGRSRAEPEPQAEQPECEQAEDTGVPFEEVRAPWMIRLEKAYECIDDLKRQLSIAESANAEFVEAFSKLREENNTTRADLLDTIESLKKQLSKKDERLTYLESNQEYVEYYNVTEQTEKANALLLGIYTQVDRKKAELKELENKIKKAKHKKSRDTESIAG